MNIDKRKSELREALKSAKWHAIIDFLDTVNSVEELEAYSLMLKMAGLIDYEEYYRKCLTQWSVPRLPEDFQDKCPLMSARLDAPQKIRILLRGADFCKVRPIVLGELFEEILYRHEVKGEKIISFEDDLFSERGDAIKILYHTQLQARSVIHLIFPNVHRGHSTELDTYIDFRTKEEM